VIRVLLAASLGVVGLAAADAPSAASVAQLAESGHCREAMPLLKAVFAKVAEAAQKKRLGLDAVRCAVNLGDTDTAGDFVRALKKQFPRDPEVLYVAVHVFSDLSIRSSRELSLIAPGSYQMHELNAEAMEAQGKPDDALEEYREVLKKEPNLHGIHYRIGRLLLSGPNKAAMKEEARHEFEEELKVDPSSAGAEYVLGELARQDQETETAIQHFSRATKLDPEFLDALVGLGRALIEGGRNADAIAPLQAAAKLQPDNPAAHFYLGTAYQRSGRTEEAGREFALQQQANEKAQRTKQEAQAAATGKEKQ
jgi:Tfp pilus assembly protein PilF